MVEFIRRVFQERRTGFYIAGLLDEKHDTIVRDIWRELKAELGIEHTFSHPTPHLTHVQAEEVNFDALYDALDVFAAEQAPFVVRTVGLGIFTGRQKSIYISVVRNPELSRIQTALIGTVVGAMEGFGEHNFINYWMPHITLLPPGMTGDRLPEIVNMLSKRDFSWEVKIDRFALLNSTLNSGNKPFTVRLTGE